MMGVINLAHGEFILIGIYGTAITYANGVPLWIAIPVGALAAGLFGLVVERTIIKRLYDRPIDSMVATWGISIILIEAALLIFGTSYPGMQRPFGAIQYGSFSASMYTIVLSIAAIGVLVLTYYVFNYTEWGLYARATLQNADAAESLGVDTSRMYTASFFFGSFLAGLAGGLYAPVVSIGPNAGGGFIIEAFVTVIVGGTNVLLGTLLSGGFLSIINGITSQTSGTLIGRVSLLVMAIVVVRLYPKGISSILTK